MNRRTRTIAVSAALAAFAVLGSACSSDVTFSVANGTETPLTVFLDSDDGRSQLIAEIAPGESAEHSEDGIWDPFQDESFGHLRAVNPDGSVAFRRELVLRTFRDDGCRVSIEELTSGRRADCVVEAGVPLHVTVSLGLLDWQPLGIIVLALGAAASALYALVRIRKRRVEPPTARIVLIILIAVPAVAWSFLFGGVPLAFEAGAVSVPFWGLSFLGSCAILTLLLPGREHIGVVLAHMAALQVAYAALAILTVAPRAADSAGGILSAYVIFVVATAWLALPGVLMLVASNAGLNGSSAAARPTGSAAAVA